MEHENNFVKKDTEDVPRYTLKKVTKPLASTTKNSKPACPVRTINEDDDGYDPYSDYVAPQEFFEKNPWD